MTLQSPRYVLVLAIILASTPAWAIDDGNPQNGLSSQAFRRNALTTNRKAVQILRSHALNPALFSDSNGYIALQLQDPNARAVMSEIVKCALDDRTTLSFVDAQQVTWEWKGELGVCQAWRDNAPSAACQELVSACVMSRVNALQKAIPIWIRGYTTERPADGPVRVTTVLRESPLDKDPAEGFPIPSFGSPCSSSDCGWRPAFVGKCVPDEAIELQLAAPASGWRMRACAGIHGCAAPSDPGGTVGSPPYSFPLGESSPASPGVLGFRCPVGGIAGGQYSVMLRNDSPPGGNLPDVRVGSGTYPAPEKQVFGFLEGAFFGNMFLPEAVLRDCEVTVVNDRQSMVCRSGRDKQVTEVCTISCGITTCRRDAGAVPYSGVHACYSLVQQQDLQNGNLGVAYLNSRICDRPDGNCFFEPPGPCTGAAADSARCTWDPASGKFSNCTSPRDRSAPFPTITSYLNDACDLIGEGDLCDQVRAAAKTEPRPGGRWTRLWGLGGLLLILIVVILAIIAIRRMQGSKPPQAD